MAEQIIKKNPEKVEKRGEVKHEEEGVRVTVLMRCKVASLTLNLHWIDVYVCMYLCAFAAEVEGVMLKMCKIVKSRLSAAILMVNPYVNMHDCVNIHMCIYVSFSLCVSFGIIFWSKLNWKTEGENTFQYMKVCVYVFGSVSDIWEEEKETSSISVCVGNFQQHTIALSGYVQLLQLNS